MVKKVSKKDHKSANNISPLMFETSWEVCNKVGGIYTVLSTKARELKKLYGDNVIFIGPDVWDSEHKSPTFKATPTALKNAQKHLELPEGISIRVGRWDIPGEPRVILVKFQNLIGNLDEVYGRMWQHFGVDSLHAYGDYDEGCAFAVSASIVIEAISKYLGYKAKDVTAHFDEWTTGMGLLNLQLLMPEAATVFTTHATSIGRSICGNGKPLYDYFGGYNGDQMAGELNMESKHSLEKAAAHNADCFTAVSELTARECEQLLDIRPQVVTPNGFEPNFVPSKKRYEELRQEGRRKLLEIASALRGHEYSEDTFIVATSGRNEYRNKGLDIFLDTIATVDHDMADKMREVVAFVLVPAWVKERSEALANSMNDRNSEGVTPDYLTHRLNNEGEDAVSLRISSLEQEGVFNNVSVIYVPCYLDGKDGIVDMHYYDLLPALDLTLFASYYEPWGYTPMESIAFGVPTITTDKSGFGQWIMQEHGNGVLKSGVEVLPRTDSNYGEVVRAASQIIERVAEAGKREITAIHKACTTTSKGLEWSDFIKYYSEAYKVANERRDLRVKRD